MDRSKEALWIDHDFEEFLEWVSGVTWVELVEQPKQGTDVVVNLPVWPQQDRH